MAEKEKINTSEIKVNCKFSLPFVVGMESEPYFEEKYNGSLTVFDHTGECAKFSVSTVKTLDELISCSGKTKQELIIIGGVKQCSNKIRNDELKSLMDKYNLSTTAGVTKAVISQAQGELKTLLRQGMKKDKAIELLRQVLTDTIENYGYGLTADQAEEVISKL